MVRFFNPGLAYNKIKPEIDAEIQRVLASGDLILRKDVEDFEKTLANYIGVNHAIGLNSCTDALYLALRALKIGPGDEVIVPSRTFVATAQVVSQVGATLVLVDYGEDFRKLVTRKTKAFIPVHIEGDLYGNMGEIMDFCNKNNIAVIEDAAQALGATQNGKRAGSFGKMGCFSFYPAKILGAFGDAGAIVTDDDKLANWLREARNHFKNDAADWGVNSRLDNLQAAVLNVKMKYLEAALNRREEIANMYTDGLEDLPEVTLPTHTPGRVWQDYIIRTLDRDALFSFLKGSGVETMKNDYPFPIPKGRMAALYESQTLRLPCNENLSNEEVEEVIELIRKFYE